MSHLTEVINYCALHWSRFFSIFLLRHRPFWLEHSLFICLSRTLEENCDSLDDSFQTLHMRPCCGLASVEIGLALTFSSPCRLWKLYKGLATLVHWRLSALSRYCLSCKRSSQLCTCLSSLPFLCFRVSQKATSDAETFLETQGFHLKMSGTNSTLPLMGSLSSSSPLPNSATSFLLEIVLRISGRAHFSGPLSQVLWSMYVAHQCFLRYGRWRMLILFSVQLGTGTPIRDWRSICYT